MRPFINRIHISPILCILIAGCPFDAPPANVPTATAEPPAEQVEASDDLDPSATTEAVAVEETVPYHNPLTPGQIADGWISLFDGHTLFGWTPNDEGVNWHVADGAITADSGPIGLLLTTVPFADFELRCEFRMEEGGNSGIFLRTLPKPADVRTDCYELNIADEHPDGFTTGAIVGHVTTDQPIPGSGGWKTFHVRCEENRVTVRLDDEPVLDYTDGTTESDPDAQSVRVTGPRSGLIGLQKNAGRIEFRNVLLRPLGMADLFNGTDLSGWHIVPGGTSEFSVEDDTIRVVNGQGFLETDDVFGDFVFQADAITHGDELNSGYFFRAERGTEDAPSNGYEVQIHNGFEDDDRTRPNNAGTGAIFRRNEARRVVSSDHEWFTTTLVAAGSRIAVWVDGYQVTDWEDTREPDPNPRRGRRDEPGHISLQGHDPTTDLSFRRLRIVELP